MKKTIVVVAGPTASGKTDFSIQLARHFNTEIVSADSRQLFIELQIGSAKPSAQQLLSIPHHFINFCSVSKNYNAGKYSEDGRHLLENLFEKRDLVILTGGSGLYIDALLYGIDELPEADEDVRLQLANDFKEKGIAALQEQLKIHDPESYSKIDIANPYRIIRALEVSITCGKPYSSFLDKKKTNVPYAIQYLALDIQRDQLYKRINSRVDKMIADGLVEEVRNLLPFKSKPALKTVGYVEIFDYLEGLISLPEAVDKIKQHTRNYAKRQITWFKKNMAVQWVKPENITEISAEIERQL